MRIVVQRVKEASVSVNGMMISRIGPGMLLLVGVEKQDTDADSNKLADKISSLRIFEDPDGKMNLSAAQVGAGILAVPQFTLFGDLKQGRRPSFDDAAGPETAKELFEGFVAELKKRCADVKTGSFKEHMVVKLQNDGPVTFILDSKML